MTKIVYVAPKGVRWHDDPECPSLSTSDEIEAKNLDDLDDSRRPCSTCSTTEPTLAQRLANGHGQE